MITMNIKGGLGNQMFQYAAGYALAKSLGVPLQLGLTYFGGENSRAFMLDIFDLLLPPHQPVAVANAQHYFQPGFNYDLDFVTLPDNTVLDGYFQSEKFFLLEGSNIKAMFQSMNKLSNYSSGMLQDICLKQYPVAVHVRRGDYVSNSTTLLFHGICEDEYYKKGLDIVDGLSGGNAHYFIFSDDDEVAKKMFSHKNNVTIVRGNVDMPWEDLTLMSACRDCIVANSSFSWWGAWLNDHADKTIIAPAKWFMDESMDTTDLIPKSWIQL